MKKMWLAITLFLVLYVGFSGLMPTTTVLAQSSSNNSVASEFPVQDDAGFPDEDNVQSLQEEAIPIPFIILAAFVISLVVSLIIVMAWKKGMNTRIRQDSAGAYLKEGSFKLTGHSDIFLYHHVTRTRREKSNPNGGRNMKSGHSGTHRKF